MISAKMKSRKNISFRTFLTSDIISNKNSKDIMEYYIPYFKHMLKHISKIFNLITFLFDFVDDFF